MYVDAETPVNCVFTVKIRGQFTLDSLQCALIKVQQKHPLLRATIKEDPKGVPHFVSSNGLAKIPVRIVERLSDTDWEEEVRSEWAKLFAGKNTPLARIVWVKGEECSELMLVCPHCISDCVTLVALFTEILLLLDDPSRTLASYQPFNSIEGLLSQSFRGNAGKIFKARLFAFLAKFFFMFKSAKPKNIGKSYLVHSRLDKETTLGVLAACKAADVTVNSALCVAFMEAFKYVKPLEANGKVICPVDIRKFINEIKPDNMFAFAPITELSLSSRGDFWHKARALKSDLENKTSAMKVHELLIMSEYFHSSVNNMVKYLKSTDGTHDVTLSNLGKIRIPEHYSNFEVEAVYSPAVAFPWRNPNTILSNTYKDEMDFSFASNDAFLPPDEAHRIMDRAFALLSREVAAYSN